MTFVDEHGLSIAPSAYYAAKARPPSARAVRDAELKILVQGVFEANYRVYGARKIWHHLRRQGRQVALHGRAADARPWHHRRSPRQ